MNKKNDLKINTNIKKSTSKSINKEKKPWVFLSIDTAEDQIDIPIKFLRIILFKLKKKFKTIYINTNNKNKSKIFPFINDRIVPTYKYNIQEINYIMSKCNLFIGNDSGPGNLSTLLKHKSIIFLSNKTTGEIKKIKPRGVRIYIQIEKLKNNIKKLINFI